MARFFQGFTRWGVALLGLRITVAQVALTMRARCILQAAWVEVVA